MRKRNQELVAVSLGALLAAACSGPKVAPTSPIEPASVQAPAAVEPPPNSPTEPQPEPAKPPAASAQPEPSVVPASAGQPKSIAARAEPIAAKPSVRDEDAPLPEAAAATTPADQKPAVTPAPTAATTAAPCGEKGQPHCPLQGWMEEHLQGALDAGDLAKLAQGLARVPSLVPDASWNAGPQGWRTIAEAGAAAAKNGDEEGTRRSCKGCHKAWRSKYKASFRTRPLPQ